MIRKNTNILRALCNIDDQPPHLMHGVPTYTNRFKFILRYFMLRNIPFEIDRFSNEFHKTFYNLYVPVNDFKENRKTLILMAHHDVFNPEFDNYNDNSASVFILMMLANLFNRIVTLDYNLLICFTDSEERGFWGANRFSNIISNGKFLNNEISHIINLELCGIGDYLWVEKHDNNSFVMENAKKYFKYEDIEELETPISDSVFVRHCSDIKNITTIGTLNKFQGGKYDKSPWDIIHTKDDTLDNRDDNAMKNVFDFLKDIIINVDL